MAINITIIREGKNRQLLMSAPVLDFIENENLFKTILTKDEELAEYTMLREHFKKKFDPIYLKERKR